MDFGDNSPDDITSVTDAFENTSLQQNDRHQDRKILEVLFLDGKMFKNFFMYLEKMHPETNLKFYRRGIWGKIVGTDTDRKYYSSVSSIRFPISDLQKYECNLEKIPGYEEEEDETFFFNLTFKSSTMLEFVKTTNASSKVTMVYEYESRCMKLKAGLTGDFMLPVEFSLEDTHFPLNDSITSDNLLPIVNMISTQFSVISDNLTKSKKQATYDSYIDFQVNDETGEKSAYVHSSEGKFKDNFGNYDVERPPDARFILKYGTMKALSLLTKVNEKGFLSFMFIDEDILRVSTRIGNFGMYDLYIFVKRKPIHRGSDELI